MAIKMSELTKRVPPTPLGDGGFDPSKPFLTRDGRTVSNRFIDKYRPDLIFGAVDGVGGAWKRSTGLYEGRKSAVNPALDLINTPIPTVHPTPAGDMAGEDDAAFVERMANKPLPDWGIDGKAMVIALAREGARLRGTAPPASVDAVAVVTDEMVDAAWAKWDALADAGQIYRTQMREVIAAALREAQS